MDRKYDYRVMVRENYESVGSDEAYFCAKRARDSIFRGGAQ